MGFVVEPVWLVQPWYACPRAADSPFRLMSSPVALTACMTIVSMFGGITDHDA